MKRVLLVVVGSICLTLGIIGAFFPIMPTTPFVMLAAFCFLKSSPELYERVKTIPWLGGFIAQYMETDSMTTRARLEAIAILWVGLIISALLIRSQTMYVVFALIGIAVTIHLWTIRRKPRIRRDNSEVDGVGFCNRGIPDDDGETFESLQP